MMNLAGYRRRSTCLADFLPWAALVETGIVLSKDGSLQRTVRFRGPDLDSATQAELVAITSRLNNALRRLDSGWAIFVEAQREPANRYPESRVPDAASRLVDDERRALFEEEGAHFESRYFLTLLWLPAADNAVRAEAWLYEGRSQQGADWRTALAGFVDRTDRVLGLIEGFMPEADWLDDTETLTYLHSCISTPRKRLRVPEVPMHLDAILAMGGGATGGLVAAGLRGGASVAGGSVGAYRAGAAGRGTVGGIAGGTANIARAGASAAVSTLRRAAGSLKERFDAGARAGGGAPAKPASAPASEEPAWATRMRRRRTA
jgi:hypothetical protein